MTIWTTIGKALLDGASLAIKEMNEREEELKRRRLEEESRKQKAEKEINIVIKPESNNHHVYVKQEDRAITYSYSLKELEGMNTEELRNEVRSISRENSIKDWDLSLEAHNLYFDTITKNYSEKRYRAKLIKFLYEKGNI